MLSGLIHLDEFLPFFWQSKAPDRFMGPVGALGRDGTLIKKMISLYSNV